MSAIWSLCSVSLAAGLCLNCWSLQELVSRDAGNYLILVEKILGKAREVSGGCWLRGGALQVLVGHAGLCSNPIGAQGGQCWPSSSKAMDTEILLMLCPASCGARDGAGAAEASVGLIVLAAMPNPVWESSGPPGAAGGRTLGNALMWEEARGSCDGVNAAFHF